MTGAGRRARPSDFAAPSRFGYGSPAQANRGMSAQLRSDRGPAAVGSQDGQFAVVAGPDQVAELSAEAWPPVPVIAVGTVAAGVAEPFDANVASRAELDRLLSSISGNPNAAAVAVHVLRSVLGLPMRNALTVESLAYGLLQGSAEHARWLDARGPAPCAPEGRVWIKRDGAVLTIVVDRPDSLNAINRRVRDELHEAFTVASSDRDIERVELRSVGRAFCIGADLSEFGTTRDPAAAHAIRMRTLPALALIGCCDRLHVHVQGACVGAGLEIAAFARRVTASPNAWFQLPELSMGLIPGAGGCVSVTRRIGRQRAGLMILAGKRIRAQTALEWGLIDAITGD